MQLSVHPSVQQRGEQRVLNQTAERHTGSPIHQNQTNAPQPAPEVLSPAQWLRVVMGFEAPFGQDRMPTVWG